MSDESNESRPDRLSSRFSSIREALELTLRKDHSAATSSDLAWAACAVAWFEGMEHFLVQGMEVICKSDIEDERLLRSFQVKDKFRALLKSFHKELCEHLGVDQAKTIKLSKAFHEVIEDICKEKG